ncbi:MAG: apolipoprotein N-acyltransferase, partial [Streptomyces sp.]
VYGAGGERVGAPLGTSASATSTYDIPLAKGVTPYVRLGDWPVHTALAVLAVLCAAEGVRSLRGPVKGRLRQPAPEPQEPRARTAHGSPAHPGR